MAPGQHPQTLAATAATAPAPSVLALSGGIGGAKLVLGLYRVLAPWNLAIAMNTGDDLVHMGLHVAPDVDTIMYTLAGENNAELGWGRVGETWSFMDQMGRLGGETWFNLGDGDVALHVRRTDLLGRGEGLGEITQRLYEAVGLQTHAWPMSDDPVRTIVETADGRALPFQNYFVEERCQPSVQGFVYEGAAAATANPRILEALGDTNLQAVILCPSNPFVSIDPILAVPEIQDALAACPAPVVAVSPLIGGKAVKGPLAKMYEERGHRADNASVLAHYADFLDGFVIDETDAADADRLGVPTRVTRTMMASLDDRDALANEVLEFSGTLTRAAGAQIASGG